MALLCAVILLAPLTLLAADLALLDAVRDGDRSAVRTLLAGAVDVNERQADGTSALGWAAYHDDLATVEMLLAAGADPNAANDLGVTPLTLACINRNSTMVDRLLKAGADPDAPQWNGETPLMTCAMTGAAEAVKAMTAMPDRGANVNATESEQDQTALMWAVAEKHPEVVRVLVDAGADVHARSKLQELPAPYIIETPGPFGANYAPTVHFPRTRGGFTALLFAGQQGDVESARILLEAGADVHASTEEDGTALVLAASGGHEELGKLLLENGADPNATDGFGMTALHYALHEGLLVLMGAKPLPTDDFGWHRPNMPGLALALLRAGADPNAAIRKSFPTLDDPFLARSTEDAPQLDPVGATPLHLAAASGDVAAMRLLVEGGADKMAKTVDGGSLFMIAAGFGTESGSRDEQSALEAARVALMLGGGAVNDFVDDDGRTPLHAAAYLGWNDMIRFLVESGAKLDVKDKYGQTPLTIAMGDPEGRVFRHLAGGRTDDRFRGPRERKETVALLLELGAAPFTGKVRDRSGE